jgi:hypothetical protein
MGMGKAKRKKHILFNLFSQNLEWVKKHHSISFKPDFSNGYICPLCFDLFLEKDLEDTLPNHLTLEDIPPVSLGGKQLALTCKTCNSRSGHELDAHLLKNLIVSDAKMFLPYSKADTTFELYGNSLSGVFEVDEKGTMKLHFQPQRSNPKQYKQFMKDMFPPKTIYNPLFHSNKLIEDEYSTPTFQMKFKETSKERRAEIALLRIAYLLAFSTLGNGFYINGGLYKVREQLLNPDKEILPKVFWLNIPFPKEYEGVNIISSPKKLQCFLIVFNLKTASISRQFAIVLPGPSSPGIKVYDFLSNEHCTGDGTTFYNATVRHIPNLDYLRKKDLVFAANWYWQKFTKDENTSNSTSDTSG